MNIENKIYYGAGLLQTINDEPIKYYKGLDEYTAKEKEQLYKKLIRIFYTK